MVIEPLDERTELLGLRHGRLDPLVTDERRGLIPQERDPVFGGAAQFPMCNLVTHLLYLSLMPELKLGPTCYHVPHTRLGLRYAAKAELKLRPTHDSH